jgi:Fe2+ or Zn2+ uptake regulation protein
MNAAIEPARLEAFRREIRRAKVRLTPQKEAVWGLFAASARGYTLPEACAALKDSSIGQATVYRTIKTLHEHGLLRFVHDHEGEHRYLACSPGHVHLLVCRKCGQAREVTDCDLTTLEKLLAAQTGFTVEGHHLEFYGLCASCSR